MCCQTDHTAVYVDVTEPVGYISNDAPADLSSIESRVVQQMPMENGRTAADEWGDVSMCSLSPSYRNHGSLAPLWLLSQNSIVKSAVPSAAAANGKVRIDEIDPANDKLPLNLRVQRHSTKLRRR